LNGETTEEMETNPTTPDFTHRLSGLDLAILENGVNSPKGIDGQQDKEQVGFFDSM
jgi:hypothetical protein